MSSPPSEASSTDGDRPAAAPDYVRLPERGDVPAPRFGHTMTLLNDQCVVLFGGAVGTGEGGHYTITADSYTLELPSNRWARIRAQPDAPTARAAHAAACVDEQQMVVFGGTTGGARLSPDDLHLLELDLGTEDPPIWVVVPVVGRRPPARYGHSMVFKKPYLIVFGGSNGYSAMCDVWIFSIDGSPYQWDELVVQNEYPPPRLYHSAELCPSGPTKGMIVIFGGRTNDQDVCLNDTWGLRQHANGRWSWVQAPLTDGVVPEPRFQHGCVFWGGKLVIVGGRGAAFEKPLPSAVYDTETCQWYEMAARDSFRHAAWALGESLFCCGGFGHEDAVRPSLRLSSLSLGEAVSFAIGQKAVGEAEAMTEATTSPGATLGSAAAQYL